MVALLAALLLVLGAVASPGCISTTCSACLLSDPSCGWCDAAGFKGCLQGHALTLFFFFGAFSHWRLLHLRNRPVHWFCIVSECLVLGSVSR
jgi:hypothetical protein